jgi:Ca-activated chloride channel homolog
MSKQESQTGWGRVIATFIASGIAAALAVSIFLPANEQARQAARRDQAIRDQIASGTRAEFDRMLKDEAEVAEQAAAMSKLARPGVPQPMVPGIVVDQLRIMPSDPTVTEFSMAAEPATTSDFLADSGDFHAILGPAGNAGKGDALAGRTVVGRASKSIAGGGNNPPREQTNENKNALIGRFGGNASGPAVANPAPKPPISMPSSGGVAISDPMPADPYAAPAADPFGASKSPTSSATPLASNQLVGKNTLGLRADVGGQTLPSATYLTDDIQYHPTGPKSKLSEEAQKMKELAEGENLRRKQAQGGEWRDNITGEQYEQRVENIFQSVRAEPLSTFSIDVDTASYTNCRRFLEGRQLPPTAAVRVEEFINYFRYDYPQPTGKDPFSVNMEMADCPWTPNHKLLRVGLKGKEIDRRERPESNLVFLVDVSGSMSSEDKLPLLRDAMHRWVNELTPNDRVTIVTYAGDAGLRLPTTRGDQKEKLHAAIETLQSGGSTHGSAGIKLAYEEATKNFLEDGGVNRVLWATDGDLNVGTTSDDELVDLITNKAKTGVFLTVLGVGTGNLKDAKLEKIADKGNGIYAYLDSPKEARKVLIEQMSGTTITIAKDVKIQIEFNPAEIAGYRLIGYENRILAAEDFANDKKDAGEIGAGHTVTALYEIIPVGAESEPGKTPAKEQLKYQAAEVTSGATAAQVKLSDAAKSGELLTLKLRFKQPDGHKSELCEFPLQERGGKFTAASQDFQFAGCVAQLAMILRDSQYRGEMTTAAIAEIAAATKGDDKDGSRAEFVELVKRVKELGK